MSVYVLFNIHSEYHIYRALFWGRLGDSLGRRPTLLCTAVVISLFGCISSFAWSYPILVTCRFFVGVGIAGVPTAFSLIMEFTPTQYRGRVGLYLQVAWTIGTVAQALLAWFILPLVRCCLYLIKYISSSSAIVSMGGECWYSCLRCQAS